MSVCLCKGYLLPSKVYKRGTFSAKMVYQRIRSWTSGPPPQYKTLLRTPWWWVKWSIPLELILVAVALSNFYLAGWDVSPEFAGLTLSIKGLFTRITQASRLTLAGGQKTVRVYKQNFTARVTLQPGKQ